MLGYSGKILRVNLSNGEMTTEKPSEDYYRRYLGGRGFIVHTLLTELPAGVDPLGPENKIVFALGPLSGQPLAGCGRNSIGAKSPMTGGFGETEAGGFFGVELRRAGFDAVIVEGVSKRPVYLNIRDGNAELRNASVLWGQEIAETERLIKEELGKGKIRTAIIGPGAEKLVRYGIVANDICHIAGRTGMGTVMGSKKLKAVVVRGHTFPEVADRQKIKELGRWMALNFKEQTKLWKYGTGAAIMEYEKTGNLPVRNFNGGRFPGAEKITAQMLSEHYVTKMGSCYACPVRCKKVIEKELNLQLDTRYGGPEYETLAALGANCGIDNLEALIKAHELCGRYGIDTISTGVTISFAMECFEKGIITREETDGLELRFGNADAMLAIVKHIGRRQGFGDLLAEGSKRAAASIGKGTEEFAIQVKGEELPMHDPRFKPGMGLSYSVNAAGPDHNTGVHDERVGGNLANWEATTEREEIPNTELSDRKARLVYYEGLTRNLPNYLGVCLFVPWNHDQLEEAMKAVTGQRVSYEELLRATERGIALSRIFNLREGFRSADDKLPRRFHKAPGEGPLKSMAIDPEKFKQTKREYYRLLGWDIAGVPTKIKLQELGIDWATEYIPAELR